MTDSGMVALTTMTEDEVYVPPPVQAAPPTASQRGLSALIHGFSKSGKSTASATTPAPRLILDAEGGRSTRFTPGVKREWLPLTEAPPIPDGTWDTCVVHVRDFQTVSHVFQWLASGQHPFRSVSVDSISEVQQRCIDSLAGVEQMRTSDWGALLRNLWVLLRQFRDLVNHPTRPLEMVLFVAMSKEDNGRVKAYAQGQIGNILAYLFDVVGYMYTQQMEDGTIVHKMLTVPTPGFEAGEAVGGRLPAVIDNPNFETMLDMIFGPRPAAG